MAEILRSPVEVGSWNPIIYKVLLSTIPGGELAGISEPSTVSKWLITMISKAP